MADSKISALPASTTPLAGTEALPVVQSGATKQVSVANLTAGRAVSALSYNATSFSRVTAEGAAIGSTGQSLQAVRTTNDSVLFLGYRTTPDAWVIGASYASTGAYKPILFATSDTARWQIEAAGNLTQKTAAKGVDFSANTPAAGKTSTLLNWYEEGTWTPSVGGDATYTTQAGTYTRIGRMVFITGRLTINVIGTGSTTTISGLPFTSANTGDTGKGTVGYFANLASNVVYLAIDCNANATTLKFASLAAAGATATSGAALLTSGTRVDFSLCYTAA